MAKEKNRYELYREKFMTKEDNKFLESHKVLDCNTKKPIKDDSQATDLNGNKAIESLSMPQRGSTAKNEL